MKIHNLKLYFLCFILSGLRIYYFFGDDSTMLWRFFFKLLHLIFIIFCFLIWFWIYSLRPHQVLIQGCTFLQPVVIINNRYFFLWLFFILWSLKIRSWKNMTKMIKFLFFILFLQPINEFVDFFNNQQQIDMKNNMNQFSNTNPQTPSSIPDIILTGEHSYQFT